MRDCTNTDLLWAAVRLMLGGILCLAGILKVVGREDARGIFSTIGLGTGRIWALGFRLLPLVEIALGGWLLLGFWLNAGIAVTLLLLLMFTAILFQLLRRGYDGRCACFGAIDRHPVGRTHLLRNVVLLAAAAGVLAQSARYSCVAAPPWQFPLQVPFVALGFVVVGALIFMLAAEVETFFNGVSSLFREREASGEGRTRGS